MTYMCSFSNDGQVVGFGCMDGSAWVYEVSGGLIGTLRGHDDEVLSLRFSPDGRSIVTASMDGTARIWSVRDDTLPTILGHRGEVRAVFSPDGKRIATSGWGDTARLWDVRGQSFIPLRGHGDSIFSIQFDREGTQLVTASADCVARTWALDGRPLEVFSHPGVGMVKTAAFSPDGKLIATGCRDSTVWVWRRDGSVLDRFEVGAWVSHLEFHPDGKRLLVARGHAPVVLLTLESGSIRELPFDGYHATFTPSGEILVGCRENGRVVRLSAGGDVLGEFPAHEESLTWVEMSPKEDRIVTASNDGTAKIWTVDGTLQLILRGDAGVVNCASFSPDGNRVVTGFGDGTARTWLVYEEALLELADARASREFSEAEFHQYEQLLDVPATEAKELVDRLFEELGSKERVLERLRRDSDLDRALRETASRFAEARSDMP
jgi:WD40 repeat protein